MWFFPVAGWWRTLPGLRGGCNQFRIRRQRARPRRDRTFTSSTDPRPASALAFDRGGCDMVSDAESDLFFPAPVGFIDRSACFRSGIGMISSIMCRTAGGLGQTFSSPQEPSCRHPGWLPGILPEYPALRSRFTPTSTSMVHPVSVHVDP